MCMISIMTHRDARSLDHAILEEMRRQGVRRVLAGETQVAVAISLDVNKHAVSKWMRAFRERGEEALASTKATGRPPTLTAAQLRRLTRIIVGKNPRQLNFGPALWTRALVGDLIESLFGVVLDQTTVGRILRHLGFSPQKPVRRSFKRNDEECQHWMQTEFPRIVRHAAQRKATLLFEDETGVHEDHSLGRTWGKKGQTPVVTVKGTRRRINVISAISPRGQLWFRCYKGMLTAALFVEFLAALLEDTTKPIELVLDRHPAHIAAKTRRFLQKNRHRIRVHWLPSYAPNLNPSEHIWSLVKGAFQRDPLNADEDIAQAVEIQMLSLQHDRDMVQSFFRHPEVRYVREALNW